MKRTELKRSEFKHKPSKKTKVAKPKAQREYTPMLNNCCYFSGTTEQLEVHHIFQSSNRSKSEKYGLKVYLNHYWHNKPPNGVHHNKANMLKLHQYGQQVFQERYPELDFCKTFQCKDYLSLTEDDEL